MPSATFTPSGISALIVKVEFWPGTTGSGRKLPETNLKTEVPDEQSFTEFWDTAVAKMATRASKRAIIILELLKDIKIYLGMEVYVFRKDRWHQILLPVDTESWTTEEKQIYGSLVVSYGEKGFSKEKAEQLAEAFVFQQKHHGLTFPKQMETLMRGL